MSTSELVTFAVIGGVAATSAAFAVFDWLIRRGQRKRVATRVITTRIDEVEAAAARAEHDRARDDLFLHPYAEHVRDELES